MTTPNIEWLIGHLRSFSGTSLAPALMHQAADTLQSQAERIKALELDLDVQAGSIEAVQAVNMRQAERIEALEGQLDDATAAARSGQMIAETAQAAAARLLTERDELRAQLAALAATEPVAWRGRCTDPLHDWCLFYRRQESQEKFVNMEWQQLFTRPMPAQDMNAELVEALEKLARLGNGDRYGNSDGNMIARDALSKYKGAK